MNYLIPVLGLIACAGSQQPGVSQPPDRDLGSGVAVMEGEEPMYDEQLGAGEQVADLAGTTVLASVTARDVELQFLMAEDGTAFVMELASAEATGPLDGLIAQGATPLEMFLALSDDPVPVELVDHHAEFGQLTHAPAEPRALVVSSEAAPPGFLPGGGAASCTYAADGAWFDNNWSSWGWNWHWYWSAYALGGKYTAAATDSLFYTHVCNYSRGPYTVVHCAMGSSSTCQNVAIGSRSTIFAYGAVDTWRGLMTATGGGSWANYGWYRLGGMAVY